MSKINLTTKQIMNIATYIEDKELNEGYIIVCVDEMIRDAIDAWNGGAR